MKNKSIKDFINIFRYKQAKSQLYRRIIQMLIISISLVLILGILESILYFSILTRIKIAELFSVFLFLGFIYIGIQYLFNKNSIFNNYNDHSLAKKFGKREPQIGDRLLNALQLEESLSNLILGQDLAKHALLKVNNDINKIPVKSLSNPISYNLKRTLTIILIIGFSLFMVLSNSLPYAYQRLIQPNRAFQIPVPFTLNSLSGNSDVLGGDSLTISIAGFGELPDSIDIIWKNQADAGVITTSNYNEVYYYTFTDITRNIYYWAEYKSPYWFSAWNSIITEPDTIFVTDRPIVENIDFTIFPPKYTNKKKNYHPGNITDISILEGSQIQLISKASKILDSAWILLNEHKNNLQVNQKDVTGVFYVNEETSASIYIQDENEVQNLYPPHYRISVIPDSPPDMIIRTPSSQFELDESNIIYLDIQTSDDFGFYEAWIEYQIKAPEYLNQDTILYKKIIPNIQTNVKSQQIYHEWNISNLSLAPEDELHFQIFITDNNTLTGPSTSNSSILIGRYPSLEDLFNRIEEKENQVEEYNEEIQINIDDVKELVEELELELLKSEEISWEQENKVTETIEKMDEIFEQIEKVQETMEKIQEQAEKNNLVSDELVQKFSDFQELLDEIMTPEMLEAMDKIQEAMEEMDPQKMLDALENFEFDLSAFEEQLDRFIEMFELALAEQKMDEVVKRLEKLLEEQNNIFQETLQNENIDMNNLASRERRQEENFKTLEKTMKDAANAMEDLSNEASDQLNLLVESELTKNTKSDLNETRKHMQSQNRSSAIQSAKIVSDGLSEMLNMAQNIQSQFQEDTVDEILRKFLALIKNLLFISQQQENLIVETEGLRSRSPKIIETAVKQDKILRQNQQFILQLTELSRETFHISPLIATAIGKTKTSMDRTISRLEQKQTTFARKEMKNILNSLNEIANLLLDSVNQMQMNGSGSGMEQFMEQMEKMSQQQEGINQGTMNLSQLGMMAQQKMMEQLQKQQEELKQKLEELLNENPGKQSGGLSKANQDMEEVIEDFRKRQVDRRTKDRQQRILSRMLDSQKSLTQKDYSEKRKSNVGSEIIYSGPTGLPHNKGERDMLLINAMESALQEGHSNEYQNMMKQYFRSLQKKEELISE